MKTEEAKEPGAAWVKDGRIYVRNPQDGAPPATLIPTEGVRLYVNGVEKDEPTPVREEDEIRIEPEIREEPGRIAVLVDPNKFKAYLDVRLTARTSYRLLDSEPQETLPLEAVPKTEQIVPLDTEAVRRLLAENGVTHGIKEDALAAIYQNPSNGRYLVAEGQSPEPATDERVEVVYNMTEEAKPLIHENGTVDYRDLGRFQSVEPGTVLAVKHPGIPGKPGFRVNGEQVEPSPPKVIELEAGHGAAVSPDGMSVTATISGRPVFRQTGNRYIVSVDPQLVIKGDVNLETGNVDFRGSVQITGNVIEAMKVKATGNVTVGGEVAEAVIEAQGNVSARSIISSTVHAGGQMVYYEKFKAPTAELLHALIQALKGVGPLLEHAAAQKQKLTPGAALLFLIDGKYQQIPKLIKELVKLVEQAPQFKVKLEPVFRDTISGLKDLFLGINLATYTDLEPVGRAIKDLSAIQAKLATLISGARARVTAQYVLNSHIEASGDVIIAGQGAYNSTVRSGGSVRIEGIFRGGELEAQDNVFIAKAGSDIGVKTVVKVPSGKKIAIKKAYPGVVLQVGKQIAEVAKPQREINTSIDSDGRIELNAISWDPGQEEK